MHNGIIENFRELRERADQERRASSTARPTPKSSRISSTDEMNKGKTPVEAVAATLKQLRGALRSPFCSPAKTT